MFGPPPDTVTRPVRIVRPKRPPVLLACGKCLKKAAGGKAIRRALKDALADRPGARGKPPRLARTGCLGLCPKGAVVLASAATLARGETVLVRDAAEVAAAFAVLLPGDALPAAAPAGQDGAE